MKKNLWVIALVLLVVMFTGLLTNPGPQHLDVRKAFAVTATPTATATATPRDATATATATPAWTETGN